MFGQMCEHGFLVCGLEGGGPPRWEESWSHACGPGVARPSDSQGWGPSLSCFFSLSPTGTDVTLAGGEKNHSDAHFGSHLIGTALLGAGVTHWLHFTGKAEAEATGGSEASWGPGAGPPSLSLGRRLLPVQVDDAGDEAVAVGGARPHLELGGGQFPPVYSPGLQPFPCPSLLQPIQGGLQRLVVSQVGWVGPGGQTHQPTWGGVGGEQTSEGRAGARDREVVSFPLTSSQAEVRSALNPGQLFPISKPLGLTDPSARHTFCSPSLMAFYVPFKAQASFPLGILAESP